MNVVALLPYLVEHYDEPSSVCIDAAVSVADVRQSHTDANTIAVLIQSNMLVECCHVDDDDDSLEFYDFTVWSATSLLRFGSATPKVRHSEGPPLRRIETKLGLQVGLA